MKTAPRIVLIGFMGSGKTAVGHALARLLHCEVTDLDQSLCQREQCSIPELIEAKGEAYFRRRETDALRNVLATNGDGGVLALGGGTWTVERNRALLIERGYYSVWLDAPFGLCWQRIVSDACHERPLAQNRAAAQKLYDERRALYELADRRVEVIAENSIDTVAGEIMRAADALEIGTGLNRPITSK